MMDIKGFKVILMVVMIYGCKGVYGDEMMVI